MTVMYLYLLQNNISKIFYIGTTNDINRRLREHNSKGRHFTNRVTGEWELINFKELSDEVAKLEEKRLKKSKNKKYIEWYFRNLSP